MKRALPIAGILLVILVLQGILPAIVDLFLSLALIIGGFLLCRQMIPSKDKAAR